jgi:hypothetical protein
VELELTSDQRAQIELIALFSGKTPAEVLLEAAEHLIDRHSTDGLTPLPQEFEPPAMFTREQLEQRFAQMLRHQRRR